VIPIRFSDVEARTRRERALDAVVVLACAALGGLLLRAQPPTLPPVAWWLDAVVGGLGCVALWWRRSRPGIVALVGLPVAAVSFVGSGAVAVALGTLASRRGLRPAAVVALADVVLAVAGSVIKTGSTDGLLRVAATVVLAGAAVTASGLYLGARRELVASLRARVAQAEREKQVEAERARAAERARIAQEMHDVIAHRLALISLQSGGLQVDPATAGTAIGETAARIQQTSRLAMSELRDVIGVLRADGEPAGPGPPDQPQPTLRDVRGLVDAARDAGLPVQLDCAVAVDAVPDPVGRDVHRVVQECLTNVGKHAGRAETVVRIDAPGERRLRVVVRNRLDPSGPAAPGAGSGLVGLDERVTRAGGRFASGADDGWFTVRAELEWA
jgi:signal transduction histidine kinase